MADQKHDLQHLLSLSIGKSLASYPGSLRGGERAWYTLMRYFPSKSWEFVFLSIYYSVNVTLDLSCIVTEVYNSSLLRTLIVMNLAIKSE